MIPSSHCIPSATHVRKILISSPERPGPSEASSQLVIGSDHFQEPTVLRVAGTATSPPSPPARNSVRVFMESPPFLAPSVWHSAQCFLKIGITDEQNPPLPDRQMGATTRRQSIYRQETLQKECPSLEILTEEVKEDVLARIKSTLKNLTLEEPSRRFSHDPKDSSGTHRTSIFGHGLQGYDPVRHRILRSRGPPGMRAGYPIQLLALAKVLGCPRFR